ncbi:MAG: extracellular solute-binding protein [Oscillospiraceae bacterium]|jgi:multiple sugar transport system substrate-binding protein|nr:extracellular solute-binding protein [Oscillospiraceae bacterium]
MRKAASVLLAVVFVAALFVTSGCHGSRGQREFELPESFDTSKDYEITFWAKNDTNKAQTDIYKRAIADFEALYPNIKVVLRLYTDYGKIYNDVITNLSTGTTPNVCITYPDHIATYKTGTNAVVPLDNLFSDDKYGLGGSEVKFDAPTRAEIVPRFLDESILDGRYYAIPFMRSTEACYVNKTFVEALGYTLPDALTWDFIWEVSDAAMAKAEDGTFLVNGQNVMIPFIYKSTDNMMIQQLRQKGAGYATAAGEIQMFNDTTTETLYTIAEHVKNGAFSTFKISSYPGNFLNAGQCIFAIDSTAGATWMGTDAPLTDIAADKLVRFETVVMPVPQYDTGNLQMISQGPSVCIFNKDNPQEVLASWLFAQYLLTDEVQIAYSETEGYVPVTTKARNSDAYRDYLSRIGENNTTYYYVKIKASELLLNNIDNTFITPPFNGSMSLRDAAGQLIENTVKSVKRKESIDAAYIEKLYDDVSALYRLDQVGAQSDRAAGGDDLGELPETARILLLSLGGVWILIALYALAAAVKRKYQKKRRNPY